MIASLLLLLAASDLPQELRSDEFASRNEGFVRVRVGGWASEGFEFQAVLPGNLRATSDGQAMWSIGVDGGVILADHYLLFATLEQNLTDDINSEVVGLCVGYREFSGRGAPVGVPDEVSLYAGGIWGTFEIDASGFDDFDDAVGLRAGLALTWRPARGIAASAIVEYRLIEFEYQGEVVDGDKQTGGSTIWAGLGLDFRF